MGASGGLPDLPHSGILFSYDSKALMGDFKIDNNNEKGLTALFLCRSEACFLILCCVFLKKKAL